MQECGHGSGESGWTYTGHRNVKARDAVTTRSYTCTTGGQTTAVTQAQSAHSGRQGQSRLMAALIQVYGSSDL